MDYVECSPGGRQVPSEAIALDLNKARRRRGRMFSTLTSGRTVVLLFGMTNTTIVSVKIPTRILEQMPQAGRGRSGFIVQALEEKIARRRPMQWTPKTERGRRMAALLRKGRSEREPLLSDAQIEQELKERRGRNY